MTTTFDTPLLTLGQIRTWEDRKQELEAQIKASQDELAFLSTKLDAARFFLPEENEAAKADRILIESITGDETHHDAESTETLPDAIVRVISLHPQGALPNEIRNALISSGFDAARLNANPGYLYTVLGRLLNRGKLEKRRNGMYRKKIVSISPQVETGAVAAPVLITASQSVEAAPSGPKGNGVL